MFKNALQSEKIIIESHYVRAIGINSLIN